MPSRNSSQTATTTTTTTTMATTATTQAAAVSVGSPGSLPTMSMSSDWARHSRSGYQAYVPLGGDGRIPVMAERYKTKMCQKFVKTGSCPYTDKCMFAHGEEEMRTTAMNLADGLITEAAIKAYRRGKKEAARRAERRRQKRVRDAMAKADPNTTTTGATNMPTTVGADDDDVFLSSVSTEAAPHSPDTVHTPSTTAAHQTPTKDAMSSQEADDLTFKPSAPAADAATPHTNGANAEASLESVDGMLPPAMTGARATAVSSG